MDERNLRPQTAEIARRLRGFFRSWRDVLLAFLFGSQMTGKTFAESDVDVAVYFSQDPPPEGIYQLWGELEDLLRREVDLVVLNTASATLAWEAIQGVPLLLRDDGFYLGYMLQVSGEAEDFQDLLFDLWQWREEIRAKR